MKCLKYLVGLLYSDGQLDAAEEAASRMTGLLPEKGNQSLVCESHRLLGNICQSKGKTKKAIHHFELALGIAASFNWHGDLFLVHYDLARLFLDEGRFDDACDHIGRAKSHTVDSAYNLGRAVEPQATVWYAQSKPEEARSEALRAADVYEKLGVTRDLDDCRELLWKIEKKLDCELLSLSHFLRVLTFRSKPREPNDGIDGCVEFFECILPQVSDRTLSLPPPSLAFFTSFLSKNFLPFIRHLPFVVPLLVFSTLPPVLRLSISLYLFTYICVLRCVPMDFFEGNARPRSWSLPHITLTHHQRAKDARLCCCCPIVAPLKATSHFVLLLPNARASPPEVGLSPCGLYFSDRN